MSLVSTALKQVKKGTQSSMARILSRRMTRDTGINSDELVNSHILEIIWESRYSELVLHLQGKRIHLVLFLILEPRFFGMKNVEIWRLNETFRHYSANTKKIYEDSTLCCTTGCCSIFLGGGGR